MFSFLVFIIVIICALVQLLMFYLTSSKHKRMSEKLNKHIMKKQKPNRGEYVFFSGHKWRVESVEDDGWLTLWDGYDKTYAKIEDVTPILN